MMKNWYKKCWSKKTTETSETNDDQHDVSTESEESAYLYVQGCIDEFE